MKEELPNEKLCEADDKEIDIKELLFKYLIHWPWFVGTVVACLIAAYVYLYVATPVYNISATVLIKDDKKGGSSNNVGGLDELGLNGLITSSQSIDNEIEVLRSKTLVKEVVSYLNLYVTYQDEDLIPSKELYKTSPVQVNMTPQEAEKLKKNMIGKFRNILKSCLPFFLLTGERFLSFRLLILFLWKGMKMPLLLFRVHGISQLLSAVP